MSPERSPERSPEKKAGVLTRWARSINNWVSHFVTHHTTTEWLVGLAIILVWAVVAFASVGPAAALAAVLFAVVLHYIAMETGTHLWLWMSTTAMLIFVIVAYATVLESFGPIALAVGGTMVLAYNETVRLNYNRRRNAVIDPAVFTGSIIALALAAVVGISGIGLSVLMADQAEQSWIWMPAAVLTMMVVAYAATLLPARGVAPRSRQRWEPGTRIPPRPVAGPQPGSGQNPSPPPPPPPRL